MFLNVIFEKKSMNCNLSKHCTFFCYKKNTQGGFLNVRINNPPLSNIVYLLLFPILGVHLSPYWSFGATMNICAIGAIGATGANPYIIGAHSECHQQPPSVGCGR